MCCEVLGLPLYTMVDNSDAALDAEDHFAELKRLIEDVDRVSELEKVSHKVLHQSTSSAWHHQLATDVAIALKHGSPGPSASTCDVSSTADEVYPEGKRRCSGLMPKSTCRPTSSASSARQPQLRPQEDDEGAKIKDEGFFNPRAPLFRPAVTQKPNRVSFFPRNAHECTMRIQTHVHVARLSCSESVTIPEDLCKSGHSVGVVQESSSW